MSERAEGVYRLREREDLDRASSCRLVLDREVVRTVSTSLLDPHQS